MLERKDIAKSPEWPEIHFGDGTWARLWDTIPSQNSEGVEVTILKLIASEKLIARHNIPEDMIDEQRHIVSEIPSVMLVNLDPSPTSPKWLCYLDVFGRPCPATRYILGYIEAEKLIGLQKMLALKKAENAWLKESLYKATTNNMKWMKEQASVTDLFNINVQNVNPNQPQQVGPVREL